MKVQSGIVALAERFTRRKLKTEARDCERRRRAMHTPKRNNRATCRWRKQWDQFLAEKSLLLGERTTGYTIASESRMLRENY